MITYEPPRAEILDLQLLSTLCVSGGDFFGFGDEDTNW